MFKRINGQENILCIYSILHNKIYVFICSFNSFIFEWSQIKIILFEISTFFFLFEQNRTWLN